MRSAVHRRGLRSSSAKIAEVCSAIGLGIAVQYFLPGATPGHSDAVAEARNRREVKDNENDFRAICRFSEKRQHALVRVVGVDPFKSVRIAIQFVKSAFGAIDPVQVTNPAL